MSKETKVDVIIFGATGITGKVVVVEFIKLNQNKYTWAVAGRNSRKLRDVLDLASVKTGQDVSKTTIILADCEDEGSLEEMASRGKVIINCCGPYKLFGEPVVKACIKNGTHHIDISGEPEFIENIRLKYQEDAEKNGVYIINACGFEYVATDFGIVHFTKKFPGVVNLVESFMSVKATQTGPSVGIGTWKSIVNGISSAELSPLKMLKKTILSDKSKLEPRLKFKAIHKSKICKNKFCVPFPGADALLVSHSQELFHKVYKERPVQYEPYFVVSSFLLLFLFLIMGSFLIIISQFHFGRKLLLKYPEFFSYGILSREGPSEEVRASSVVRFRFKGEGWSEDTASKFEDKCQINIPMNKSMLTEVSITDFGYGFTAKSSILGVFMILTESDKIPSTGGVLSPGGAFARTSFLEKLQENGFSCKVLNCDT